VAFVANGSAQATAAAPTPRNITRNLTFMDARAVGEKLSCRT
jgi:hypothetical protein